MVRTVKSTVAVLLLLSAGVAHAQTYPAKPVRMVIHIGPGSSMDIVGRVLAQKLNETWGQPVAQKARTRHSLRNPAGTPAKVIDKIARDIKQLLKTPEMRERFTALGAEAEGTSPAEFKTYFRNDMEKVAQGR